MKLSLEYRKLAKLKMYVCTIMRRLYILCWWMSAQVLKPLRRRVVLFILCTLSSLVVLLLYQWQLMCTNIHTYRHITNICKNYLNKQVDGDLCYDLCQPKGVTSLTCHSFYMEKEAIFSGVWRNTPMVFKSLKRISNENEFAGLINDFKYPSEEEFAQIIKNIIMLKFNIAISESKAGSLSYVNHQSVHNRHKEMEHIWSLLQDNEYLALNLYESFGIFPNLIGTCGTLYAVQKLNYISGFWHLMTLYDSKSEWEKRVKISIMILNFLQQLEKLSEPLLLCDIKINHFGVTDDFKKVMYLDLDSVHPVSIANKITADGSNCKQHSDCDFIDCRSFCNLVTHKCQYGVTNNNLQIVCEKIFLGWVMSGKVMVPGLLLGPRAPRVLIEVLEQCANPNSELGVPRASATTEISKRLHSLLTHLI